MIKKTKHKSSISPSQNAIHSSKIHKKMQKSTTLKKANRGQKQKSETKDEITESTSSLNPKQKKDYLINHALHGAKSQPYAPEKKNRFLQLNLSTITAACAVAVLLTGYITYLNLPTISIKIAASKAGIEAGVPTYSPYDFKFDDTVAYASGELEVSYKSTKDDNLHYKIVEKKSSWDSSSLLVNYVETKTDQFETFQKNGLTIYTFEDQATWSNGGVWYTISNNARLTNEQLLDIAISI